MQGFRGKQSSLLFKDMKMKHKSTLGRQQERKANAVPKLGQQPRVEHNVGPKEELWHDKKREEKKVRAASRSGFSRDTRDSIADPIRDVG